MTLTGGHRIVPRMTEHTLDLDAARADRAKARAAANEARGTTLPIRFGGKVIADLEAEFPISVLEPLTAIDVDIAYVVRAAVQMMTGNAAEQRARTVGLLADVLGANPKLPGQIIDAAKAMARRLLGDEGYEAFAAMSPTAPDIQALIQGLLAWYGVSLGESSPSPELSQNGSGTLNPTSSGTTNSMPEASGKTAGSPDSSAPAAS